MEAIIIQKRSFVNAFRQAELDMNNALKVPGDANRFRDAAILDGVQKSLSKLKERLIES